MSLSAMPLLFAEFELPDIAFSWRKVSPATREGLIVFGALLVITILLLIWAAFLRKRGRRHHSSHRRHHGSREAANQLLPKRIADAGSLGDASPVPVTEPAKKRRRRRPLPTNPTLAQTGGLPPIRTEGPPETSS